jgi:hypothetical protein
VELGTTGLSIRIAPLGLGHDLRPSTRPRPLAWAGIGLPLCGGRQATFGLGHDLRPATRPRPLAWAGMGLPRCGGRRATFGLGPDLRPSTRPRPLAWAGIGLPLCGGRRGTASKSRRGGSTSAQANGLGTGHDAGRKPRRGRHQFRPIASHPDAVRLARIATARPPTFGSPPLHHIPTRSGRPASRPPGHQRSDRPRYTTSRRDPVGPHRDRAAANVRIAPVTPRPDAVRLARIATARPPTFGSPRWDLGMICGRPRDPGRWPGLASGCHVVAEDGRPLDLGMIYGRPRDPGRWPGLPSSCHVVAEGGRPCPSPEGTAPRQPRPTAWESVMTRAESPSGAARSSPRCITSRRGPVGPHRDRPAANVRIAPVTPHPDAVRSARIATARPPTFGSPRWGLGMIHGPPRVPRPLAWAGIELPRCGGRRATVPKSRRDGSTSAQANGLGIAHDGGRKPRSGRHEVRPVASHPDAVRSARIATARPPTFGSPRWDLGMIYGRPRVPGRWPRLASGCHFVAEGGRPLVESASEEDRTTRQAEAVACSVK